MAPTGGYLAGDRLLNAGRLVLRTFAVDANYNLQQQTLDLGTGGTVSQDLFPQIVALRAMYGKDTNADGVVDTYDNTTPTTNAGWMQVRAVRIALVARSSSYQKDEVTAAAPVGCRHGGHHRRHQRVRQQQVPEPERQQRGGLEALPLFGVRGDRAAAQCDLGAMT